LIGTELRDPLIYNGTSNIEDFMDAMEYRVGEVIQILWAEQNEYIYVLLTQRFNEQWQRYTKNWLLLINKYAKTIKCRLKQAS